jgi:hypothetical protein
MALRIRRGTELERLTVVFAEGEIVYATDTKRLYVGDGVTAGGIAAADLLTDSSPQLGNTLDLNSHDIIGFGNINIQGDITASGTLTVPTIITDVQGSIFGDDSTPLVDGANNKLVLNNNSINDLQDVDVDIIYLDQILKWNGTHWSAIDYTLGTLTNVDTAGIQDTQIIQWNAQNSNWLAADYTLNNLTDVDVDIIYLDQILKWNGTYWSTIDYTLEALTNVDTAGIQDTQIIQWNAQNSNWLAADYTLNNLTDVNFTNGVAQGQTITYDQPTQSWLPTDFTLSSLDDVNTTGIVSGNLLKYDGTEFVPYTLSINDLNDVIIDTLTITLGDTLQWNGSEFIAAAIPQPITSLSDLADTNVLDLQIGNTIIWGGSEWVNATTLFSDLADTEFLELQIGETIIWDGVNWVNSASPEPITSLSDLADTNVLDLQIGNTIIWDGSEWVNVAGPESITSFSDLTDTEFFDLQIGETIIWDGVNWVNSAGPGDIFQTDIQGSVYSLDSSILVDAETSTINVQRIIATEETFTLQSNNSVGANFNFTHNIDQSGGRPRLYMTRSSSADLSTDFGIAGSFEVIDSGSNGNITHNKMLFTRERGVWFVTPDGDQSTNDACITIYSPNGVDATRKGRLGVGTVDPAEKLDVRGNITTTGFVQFGRYTTLERDDLTTTNTPQYATNYGMVIYNTDTNKFQGWQNTGGTTPEWVDLS